jgi:hypothetical protein
MSVDKVTLTIDNITPIVGSTMGYLMSSAGRFEFAEAKVIRIQIKLAALAPNGILVE